MLQIHNKTPFSAALNIFADKNGIDTAIGVVKASFDMGSGGIRPSQSQPPVVTSDEYWAEPGNSSIKYASEMSLPKPATDIVMNCHAVSPGKDPVKVLKVGLSVGAYHKSVIVYGDRYWRGRFGCYTKTSPEPFIEKPIIYENAFGGTDPDAPKRTETRNPVGCGIKTKKWTRVRVPNVLDPKRLIYSRSYRPEPAGFGYIAPNWAQRVKYAGTYDEKWKKEQAPFLPKDFDPRFFNAAHPDLITRGYLLGGERVRITNAHPKGVIEFSLPKITFSLVFHIAGQRSTASSVMDTVLLEPDENRFSMIFRASEYCDKRALKVESMEVQAICQDGNPMQL
jgi:hypothetical protein